MSREEMMPSSSSNDSEHITSNGGMNLPNSSHGNDIRDWIKSADGKFESLGNDNRSMKDKMNTLQSKSERMEEFIKVHLPMINLALAAATSNSLGGEPTAAAVLTSELEAKEGFAVKRKKKKKKKGGKNVASTNWVAGNLAKKEGATVKKKKKKKKKKGGNKVVMNWVAGNLAKIAVGLLSIALLVSVTLSMTLGQGEGGIGGTYRSLLRKQTRQSSTTKIESTVDSQHKPNEEQLGDDGGEKVSHQRTTQANSMPPTSTSSDSSLYYPVWKNGGHCDNDSSQRPSNYNQLSTTFFETAEECCNHWFASQDDNECMENSPSPHPQTNPVPQDVEETGVPTSSTTASDSPTAPDLPDSSQQQQPSTATETDNEASNGSNGPTAISSMASVPPSTSDPSNSPQDSTAPLSGIPPNASGAPEDVDTSYPIFSPAMDPDPPEDTTGEESTEPICDANPEKCGCPHLNQTDYRGSINTTRLGYQCERWDAIDWLEELLGEGKYTNGGLEENFCRNPAPDDAERAWCITTDGNPDYCSVPKCRRPTPMCTVADKKTCGCKGVKQSDYRGMVSESEDGLKCERWDAEWIKGARGIDYLQDYPNAGLEENFCRNPAPEESDRAWCSTTATDDDSTDFSIDWKDCKVPMCNPCEYDYCSVPKCRRRTPMCTVADKKTCGCEVVKQLDYRGTISESSDGFECERWDAEWIKEYWGDDFLQDYPNAGLEENFCRKPMPAIFDGAWCFTTTGGRDWKDCNVPMCNPCECMPSCDSPNLENCGCPSFLQAKECCKGKDDASSCKCTYLKDACRKSLEKGSEDFCGDAEVACYEGSYDLNRICGMYEQICSEFPSQFACDLAAEICCNFDVTHWTRSQCFCDFYTYTPNVFSNGRKFESNKYCQQALQGRLYTPVFERGELVRFYEDTGGDHWFNKTGWADEDDDNHCQWFGLTCTNGVPTEINLRKNNLTGIRSFYRLELPGLTKLDIAENNLSGTVYSGVMLFLQKLEHVDISNNEFSGYADMTFSPATKYANFSHNKFSSVGFKRFNAAYETLQVVDLSNNEIDQAASEVFLNIPPNLEELILSNNAIRGAFPDPFPNLDKIRRFATANNNINGPLPDFSR
eukprot:CAMPEP_0202030936 /NCGR_PEP_ID=MMETSP0905-20130828/64752_1 /ASSEMBLY_ACC=CAM_ASM_000554 /TAXON_ID=420261 /ORGANISM="Thalassiosira antarctica, Strain CCMP982" /LENGTH=1109 /DNA_ID=CAMNT_0048594753 /DNA_START=96 /DNA_END=3423 /DNA_ORIENTATION=-